MTEEQMREEMLLTDNEIRAALQAVYVDKPPSRFVFATGNICWAFQIADAIGKAQLDKTLSHKAGDLTLRELIELSEKGKLRIEAENQARPHTETAIHRFGEENDGYDEGKEVMWQAIQYAGWVKCLKKGEHG